MAKEGLEEATDMAYTAEISRRNPTGFLFVIDQSGSMGDRWNGSDTRAKVLSDAINRILVELITKSSKEEGIRNYFEVGVIAYNGDSACDALGFIPGPVLKPIADLDSKPLRVEGRTVKVPDGVGGIIEQRVNFPVWFEPVADGGTPMCHALQMAAQEIGLWADNHPTSFPPIVMHITDGESTDGDPEATADVIKQLATDDGNVVLFNLHISSANRAKVVFPFAESAVQGADARRLFRMSSILPDLMVTAAQNAGYEVEPGARGYGYNADLVDVVNFLNIGTRPANLAR